MDDWRDRAACLGHADPDLWFPEYGATQTPAVQQRTKKAVAVCRHCEVWRQCLEFANATGQRGIWGGLTDQQRIEWRRARTRRDQRAAARA